MNKFDKFYYDLFSESPMNIGDTRDDYSLDMILAQEKYKEILDNPQIYKKVRPNDSEISVDLYEEQDKNEVICWFVPKNNKFIYGYVCYEELPDDGIVTTSVYNDKQVRFLALKVYLYYLLKKYKYVLSDKRHTKSGKRFWENLIIHTLDGCDIYIVDGKTNQPIETITSLKDLEKYYGDDLNNERYRIKIQKSK